MKKRYSNFHRARKWYRKFRNVLYNPDGVKLWLIDHYSDLYEKYFLKATRKDLVKIDHVGPGGDSTVLVLRRFVHLENLQTIRDRQKLNRKFDYEGTY